MPASAPCGQVKVGDARGQYPQTGCWPLGKTTAADFTNLLSPLSLSSRRSAYQPKPPQPTGLTSSTPTSTLRILF
jgi:hypothetical protein